MKRERFWSFRLTPAAWGLSGPAYDEAEIAYYYEGEEMERRLAKLKTGDPTGYAKTVAAIDLKYDKLSKYEYDLRMLEIEGPGLHHERAKLDIEFNHSKISEYEYVRRIIEMEEKGLDREIALLDHDLANEVITDREYTKLVASARKEPWVGIVGDDFNVNLGTNGFSIELDWNEEWIAYLKLNGYVGTSDEDIVDQWFSDVCAEQGRAEVHYTDQPFVAPAPRRR